MMGGIRKCGICKIPYELNSNNFHKDKSRSLGFGFNCKSCESVRSHSKHIKNPRKFRYSLLTVEQKANRRNIANIYGKTTKGKAIFLNKAYQYYDIRKGYNNDVTQDYLITIIDTPCYYCGFPATGLDRIDNKQGHTISNCVPCCKECNVARMDNFTHKEMIELGNAIRQIKSKRNI